jgi:hypothetical protein
MLTRQSQVRKCLLISKMEVIYCTKESDPIRKPDQEMKGAEQLRVKRLHNILAPNGTLAYCCKEGSWDPKISCVINRTIFKTQKM